MNAGVQFAQGLVDARCIGALDVVAQEAELDLQKGQALRDRIVQFPRDEAALLGHGGFALKRGGTQALDGTRKMAGDGLQQGAVVIRQGPGLAIEQVELTHHALMQAHRHADHGLEAFAGTVPQARCRAVGHDGDHARRSAALGLAAQAVARGYAQLFVDDGLRQAVRRQQQVLAVGFVRPAHGRSVGAGHLAHLPGDALRQRLQRLGARHEGRRLIQRGQARALGFQMLGLFLHLGFKVLVQALKSGRHAVETGRERAEFVVCARFNARAQITPLHACQAGLQPRQWIEDEQVGRVEQGDRTADGQRHHHELDGVQDGREA